MKMQDTFSHFLKNGWILIDLPCQDPVWHAREQLQKKLQELTSSNITLEDYHLIAKDDPYHTDIQLQMTNFFRAEKFAKRILSQQTDFFKHFVGLDLLVQKQPYLRMTRPGKPQDNVGYHRDTFYGGSPYELSVLIPYVECDANMTLKVLSGSHLLSEKLFPVEQYISEDVTKGSDKHKLGFLYAPKLMEPSIEEKMEPVPLKIGQVLIFSLAIVHGAVENKGQKTRWSSDVRVVNALAPVDFQNRPDYYEPFHSSPLTEAAKLYIQENR